MEVKLVEGTKYPLRVKDMPYGHYVETADGRIGKILGTTLSDGSTGGVKLIVYLDGVNNWDICSKVLDRCRILHDFTLEFKGAK